MMLFPQLGPNSIFNVHCKRKRNGFPYLCSFPGPAASFTDGSKWVRSQDHTGEGAHCTEHCILHMSESFATSQ